MGAASAQGLNAEVAARLERKLHEFAQLLKELGVTRRDVCRAPVERLYLRAEERWQRAGLVYYDVAPFRTSADRAEQRRFRGKIEAFATRPTARGDPSSDDEREDLFTSLEAALGCHKSARLESGSTFQR